MSEMRRNFDFFFVIITSKSNGDMELYKNGILFLAKNNGTTNLVVAVLLRFLDHKWSPDRKQEEGTKEQRKEALPQAFQFEHEGSTQSCL